MHLKHHIVNTTTKIMTTSALPPTAGPIIIMGMEGSSSPIGDGDGDGSDSDGDGVGLGNTTVVSLVSPVAVQD